MVLPSGVGLTLRRFTMVELCPKSWTSGKELLIEKDLPKLEGPDFFVSYFFG